MKSLGWTNEIDDLIEHVPEFRPIYEESVADQGEMNAFLIAGDLSSFAQYLFGGADDTGRQVQISTVPVGDTDVLRRIGEVLGRWALSSDKTVRGDLLCPGVLEMFSADEVDLLAEHLGPAALERARRVTS